MQIASSAIGHEGYLRRPSNTPPRVRMPILWQARMMRRADSPRLAIEDFVEHGRAELADLDSKQRLPKLDRLAVVGGYLGDDPFTSA